MKKHIFLILPLIGAILVSGCKGASERTLTSATGSIYECLVVMNDHPLEQVIANTWSEDNGSAYAEDITSTYKLVEAAMGAEMECMPQVEPYFKLTHVTPQAFDDFLKPTRNILIIDINPNKYSAVKAKVSTDVWSTPQAVYRIQAPSDSAFVNYWQAHATEVRSWFTREEMKRQIHFLRTDRNEAAVQRMHDKWGYDMCIPQDFMLILDTAISSRYNEHKDVEILWCCNNKGPMRRDLIIYTYPYTDTLAYSAEALNARRDSVLSRIVTGSAGAHMGTEYKVLPPVCRRIEALDEALRGSFYATEVRGLWKMLGGEAMGGPYVSHSRLDLINARVVTAEVFVFAPGQKKRNALRQAEAILYTLQMPDEQD